MFPLAGRNLLYSRPCFLVNIVTAISVALTKGGGQGGLKPTLILERGGIAPPNS